MTSIAAARRACEKYLKLCELVHVVKYVRAWYALAACMYSFVALYVYLPSTAAMAIQLIASSSHCCCILLLQ
jgi:hypothetical protein